MVATVFSVVVFLCGVFVGRGVRAERAPLIADVAGSSPVTTPDVVASQEPAPPPAGSDPTAAAPPPAVDELSYFNRLDKSSAPAEKLKPAATTPAPAARAAPEPSRLRPCRRRSHRLSRARRTLEPRPPASAVPRRARGHGLRAADHGAAREGRGGNDCAPAVDERVLGLRADAVQGRTVRLSRARRQVQDAPRGRSDGDPAAKRRAVHALDYSLALASGVLLALSFPKFGHPACGWIALAPLLVALSTGRRPSLMRAFYLGLITGVVYFAGTLYWITNVMAVYGGLPMVVAVARERVARRLPGLLSRAVRRGRPPAAARRLARRALDRRRRSCGWRPSSDARTVFGGFPWVLLGYSQVTTLPIAQLASVFGVYGVSALVASVSAAAACCVATRSRPLPCASGRRRGHPPGRDGGVGQLARRASGVDARRAGRHHRSDSGERQRSAAARRGAGRGVSSRTRCG